MDTKWGKWGGGGGGGGINWEIGIDIYTLTRIKQITNKNLLYKKIKLKNIKTKKPKNKNKQKKKLTNFQEETNSISIREKYVYNLLPI